MDWFVSREGNTFGPFSFEDLLAGARDGRLTREDQLWSTGMPDWVVANAVPGIWLPPPPRIAAQSPANAFTAAVGFSNGPPTAERHDTEPNIEPLQSGKKTGFMTRYWKGDVSLPKSYWLVNLGVVLFIAAISSAFGTFVPTLALTPQQGALAFIGLLIGLFATVVWQVVGLWRSAGNYIKTSKTPGWGWAARVLVILSVVRAGIDSNQLIRPMLTESLKLAAGVDDVPPSHMRLMNNATELEISGGMPFGTADEFEKILDAAPSVKLIHLNSLGGRIDEGYKINEIIHAKGLPTYTSSACMSACTIAFLGGNPRLLGENAKLGFHSGNFGGLDEKSIPEINARMRKTFDELSIPMWFTSKAMGTPANDIWYPTVDQLMSANIVSRVVDSKTFAMSGIAEWQNADMGEKALSAIPVYAALKSNDPDNYKILVGKFTDNVRNGKTALDLQNEIHSVFVSQILPKYLKSGPDEALANYWSSQLDDMKGLAAVDPKYCVQFLFPAAGEASLDIPTLLPSTAQTRDLEALTRLVEEAAKTPAQTVATTEDLASAVRRAVGSHLNLVPYLAEPEKHRAEPQKMCAAFLAFYGGILSLPPSQSGPLLRLIAQ